MPNPKKQVKLEAAFFDLDNTLLRGASSFLFAKAAFERNFIKRRELWRFAWQQLKFITRGESAKMLAHIEDRALSLVVGHNAAEMEAMVGITWNDYVKAKMWPETVRIAQEHIAAGREVWIITAAPVQMGEYIAKELGLTGALGTILEVKDGLLTKPVSIGARSVGWPRGEIQAVLEARIAGCTDEQIRALVDRLHAQRQERVAAMVVAA